MCADVLPVWYSGPRTKQLMNLQRGASALRGRNAVCRRSLPCVRRVDGGTTGGALWPEGPFDRPLKPGLQKRLKGRIDWGGNHLGCPDRAEKGLQCGLSGDRVAWLATLCRGTEGGTASIGNERCAAGKSNPYLSRKINLFCRRRLSRIQKRTICSEVPF